MEICKIGEMVLIFSSQISILAQCALLLIITEHYFLLCSSTFIIAASDGLIVHRPHAHQRLLLKQHIQ